MTRLVGLVAIGLAVLAGCGVESPPRPPGVGDPVPEYASVNLAGDSVSLGELHGRVVLLNVWATWCPPCRQEIPVLQALHEENAERGLEVVGVSVDAAGEAEAVRRFADQFGITYPIWHDPQERIASTFRTTGVPTTLLIDREGRLLWRHLGPITADDPELNRLLRATLAGES